MIKKSNYHLSPTSNFDFCVQKTNGHLRATLIFLIRYQKVNDRLGTTLNISYSVCNEPSIAMSHPLIAMSHPLIAMSHPLIEKKNQNTSDYFCAILNFVFCSKKAIGRLGARIISYFLTA